MRGKRVIIYAIKIQVRITPAGAGKTNDVDYTEEHHGDHPRRCGENLLI